MGLSHNFSTQVSDPSKLKEIAAQAGFVQTRGPQKGQGSIRQLLEALIQGKVAVIWRQDQTDQDTDVRQDLALQRMLLASGLISEVKPLHHGDLAPFDQIEVDGEPLSHTILRERR